MFPTCQPKTFQEYKALISFTFANKDSIIWKTSLKSPMHYLNIIFDFGGNSLWGEFYLEKVKYLVIESSYFCVE